MRYLYNTGKEEHMHIERHTASGIGTNYGLCGKGGFNRSINAPWALGKGVCEECERIASEDK